MVNDNLKNFRIIAHTHHLAREGGGRAGYHCPECGHFYAEGNFTIENAAYVLGASERKTCCGKARPTPQLFETLQDVRNFLAALQKSGQWERATLIPRHQLIVAHFNQRLASKEKPKTLH
jgi:hypothetical protein